MNKNYLLIGGLALLGTGAYFIYKKNKESEVSNEDILAKQKEAQEKNALIIIAEQKHQASIDLQNKNSKKSKIAVIQKAIGVTPDGILGPQTLNKLKQFFPLLVNLTDANLERIFTYVQANTYITPTAKVVDLDYGKTMQTPLIVPNNNSGVNVFTDTFKPF
jgi:LPXTG-motif cell wall-anchored protein